MVWETVSLGEMIELQRGYDLPGPQRRAGRIPICGSAGINGYHDTARAPGPGVSVGRSGASIGAVTFLKEAYWPHNTVLFVKDFKGNDPRFVAALLQQMQLAELNSGSAQPSLNRNFVYRLFARRPPLDIQQRIASILSAYDELIDVNTRRIAALDEMSRRLFDEWVREATNEPTAAISVPVSEIVTRSLGGDWGEETPQGEYVQEVRVVRGTDIPDLLSGTFGRCPSRYISAKSFEKRALVAGDLVIENSINAKSRASGTPFLITRPALNALGGRVIAASFCRVFGTKTPSYAALLLSDMRRVHRNKDIERYQVVAANGIANFQTTRFLAEHHVLVPRDPVRRERLGQTLADLNSSVFSLAIGNLRAARDLLLPKLISGAIDLKSTELGVEQDTRAVAA